MPPDAVRQNYNVEFAAAYIEARILGKRSFMFYGRKCITSKFTRGIKEDIEKGCYTIKCKEPRRY